MTNPTNKTNLNSSLQTGGQAIKPFLLLTIHYIQKYSSLLPIKGAFFYRKFELLLLWNNGSCFFVITTQNQIKTYPGTGYTNHHKTTYCSV